MTETLKVIPLGGLGEIGMNITAFEYGDTIIVVDCGLMFPEDHMLGIDIVVPDVSYLIENKEKVKAFIITHGHEDHTGGLPFVLPHVPAPIYATAMTRGLIENKLKEFGLIKTTELKTVKPRDKVTIGPYEIEFLRVSHSIIDGVALAITSPVGTVIHTGDFKLDQTPVDGEVTDYARFAEYGERGVALLMSDSTNVEREGYTISESTIGRAMEDIFQHCSGRIIIASFSSHIHRIQQVINTAVKFEKKIILNGRSMVANVRIARELGYLKAPDNLIFDLKKLDNINKIRAEETVLLTTGSQGEPMSALTRMAMDDHRHIKIREGDTVILSSKVIPGHEKAISNMMNHLYRRGAEVIYEKVSEVHVSGHAAKEELKIMLNLTKPRCFIPIHGEYRHLIRHARLAKEVGVKEKNILIIEDGDVAELTKKSIAKNGRVEVGKVFVDGKGVGDVCEMVLKDRRHLSRDGMVVVVIALNEKTGEIIYGPEIMTKGLILEEEEAALIEEGKKRVLETLANLNTEAKGEQLEVEEEVRRTLRRLFNKSLERRPVILPIIMEL